MSEEEGKTDGKEGGDAASTTENTTADGDTSADTKPVEVAPTPVEPVVKIIVTKGNKVLLNISKSEAPL